MRVRLYLYDKQVEEPVGYCPRCGGEIYDGEEGSLCSSCRKELSRWDVKTVNAVMEEMDFQLQKYLSDDLRSAVWNALAEKFPVMEDA